MSNYSISFRADEEVKQIIDKIMSENHLKQSEAMRFLATAYEKSNSNSNPYIDDRALETVFQYCFEKCEYWSGFGVRAISPQEAIGLMQYIKEYWGQTRGKQLCHIIIGVDTNFDTGREYTRYQTFKDGAYLDDFASTISYLIYREGFQNCFFKHVSEAGRAHVHYVINTINVNEGKKLSSHSELAYGIYNYLSEKYPDLKWTGVKYNRGLYEA